jgi:hypothetical protein
MGLHTGDGVVRDGTYVGLDVHRAARIAAVGHGGRSWCRNRRGRWSSRPFRPESSFGISGGTASRISPSPRGSTMAKTGGAQLGRLVAEFREARTEAKLTPAEVQAAVEYGQRLTVDQAVEYALAGPPAPATSKAARP